MKGLVILLILIILAAGGLVLFAQKQSLPSTQTINRQPSTSDDSLVGSFNDPEIDQELQGIDQELSKLNTEDFDDTDLQNPGF